MRFSGLPSRACCNRTPLQAGSLNLVRSAATHMPTTHPCALCSAMITSGLTGTCSPDAAHFTKDKRVCDTCLSADFSASPIPAFTGAVLRFVFFFSFLIAVVPSSLALRHYHVTGWPRLLGAFAVAAIAGSVVVGLYQFGRRILLQVRDRRYAHQNPHEASREAERFYYLAVWAALTDRAEFGRRMLAKARLMGFSDTTRLHDQTLSNIAA